MLYIVILGKKRLDWLGSASTPDNKGNGMTWIYDVKKRSFTHDGTLEFNSRYAGAPGYQNDPQYESLENRGPLPRGRYRITGAPFRHPHAGAYTIRLQPYSTNTMYGRDGFLIHGDSTRHPGEASNGCIVLDPAFRHRIYQSNDRELLVK